MPPKRPRSRAAGRAQKAPVPPQRKAAVAPKTKAAVPPQKLDELAVEDIDLDPENPRLPEEVQREATQDELLAFIARTYDPLEIAGSIARHGYFVSEPIIVFKDKATGRAIAVEGNRRLTALKLLAAPERATELGLEDAEAWEDVAASAQAPLPTRVPVVLVSGRDAVAPIIGYRHISGIEPWEPYAKARFLSQLIDRDGMSFEEAAAVVGEPERAVREQYRNYRVAKELDAKFRLDTSDVVERFGVFTRAMQDSRILEHIGAPTSREVRALPAGQRILPARAKAHAEELVRWMFGTDTSKPLFTDSRKITTLGTVLAAPAALERLRSTGNLEDAFDAAGGPEQQLVGSLQRAAGILKRAEALAGGLSKKKRRTEDVLEALEACAEALEAVRGVVG